MRNKVDTLLKKIDAEFWDSPEFNNFVKIHRPGETFEVESFHQNEGYSGGTRAIFRRRYDKDNQIYKISEKNIDSQYGTAAFYICAYKGEKLAGLLEIDYGKNKGVFHLCVPDNITIIDMKGTQIKS